MTEFDRLLSSSSKWEFAWGVFALGLGFWFDGGYTVMLCVITQATAELMLHLYLKTKPQMLTMQFTLHSD